MTEKEIAEYVIQWLQYQKWEVWQEIQFNRGSSIHDIVAVKNNISWIIEVKLSMSLTVLGQTYRSMAHFKSIAIPKGIKRHYNKGAMFAEQICKNYGIGVLLVDDRSIQEYIKHKNHPNNPMNMYGYWEKMIVKQHIQPALDRNGHRFIKMDIEQLKQMPKNFCKAGTNGGGYWTPYKQTIQATRDWLKEHPGSTSRQIIEGIKEHHYATDKSAYSNLATNLMTIEKKWCRFLRTKKGIKFYIRKGMEHANA